MAKSYKPVVIEGKLARNWWGKSWNSNLEGYADYSNRLPRGKTYVNRGSVVHLEMSEGKIHALVQGSRSKPYRVDIEIKPLSESKKKVILEKCGNRIDSLESLLHGSLPEDVENIFVGRDGLFPTPSEIRFKCSCPDSAYMCKHVAAVLYGIGHRFDSDPLMFFTLRGMEVDGLIRKSIDTRLDRMLSNADVRTDRTKDEGRVKELFGDL